MDEQKEAEIVNKFETYKFEPRNFTNFKVRRDIFKRLTELGMSKPVVEVWTARAVIQVGDKIYGGEIYNAAMERLCQNALAMWKAYCEDMSEMTYILFNEVYGNVQFALADPVETAPAEKDA